MASRSKNFVVDIGANFSANVVAYANGSSESALDLSGYSAANGYIKKSYYTANVAAIFNVWIQDATSGIVNLTLDRANTIGLSPGNYVYDVMIQSPDAFRSRIVEGIITATPGVSR